MPDNTFYLTTSPALHSLESLETFAEAPVKRCRRGLPVKNASAMLAWGRKPSAAKAEAAAQKLGLPVIRLEDGFLRSVEPGAEHPPLSLIWDEEGVYYDASQPCRLDRLLAQPLSMDQRSRAGALVRAWRAGRVSKYNHARERRVSHLEPFVLVVDQTFADASVAFGQADARSFQLMLSAALERYPNHTVVVKTHPDVVAGRKSGYLTDAAEAAHERVHWMVEDAHAPSLLDRASAVFCVTSQMGFEALLWGKPVHVFGMPFYAGRGLTEDALPPPRHRSPADFLQLVHASLIDYPRYVNPETGRRCQVEEALQWLALQRQQRERFPEMLYTPRVPVWKRKALNRFVAGSVLVDERKARVPEGATRIVWGLAAAAEPVVRVEDGFIRSVGLGGDLVQPLSWVLDDVGMYYDATRPSRLEHMLQRGGFEPAVLERAADLIRTLAVSGTTKYNTGLRTWQRPEGKTDVLLVPGQVESDASIRYGAVELRSNIDLLARVRRDHPDAWIVYKPHPDVIAGLRLKGEREGQCFDFCDEVVADQDMAHMLAQVDGVHTLTSLSGFEALIRGRPVTCYGQPFYAGWGLTTDIYPCGRRTRKISVEELVAGALIRYPTYVSQVTGQFTTVERVIEELVAQRRARPAGDRLLTRLSRKLRTAWAH
ncbi:MAG: capsular polysaccharide biosynthesis protein [Pseudomonadota bacterium]